MAEPQPVAPNWSNADDPNWTAAVDEPPWNPRHGNKGEIVDMYKELTCPYCAPHGIVVRYDEMAWEGLRDLDAAKPSVRAECKCGFKHIGAPPDAEGCGRIGRIRSPKQWKPKGKADG